MANVGTGSQRIVVNEFSERFHEGLIEIEDDVLQGRYFAPAQFSKRAGVEKVLEVFACPADQEIEHSFDWNRCNFLRYNPADAAFMLLNQFLG
jgi:hypothetical protein